MSNLQENNYKYELKIKPDSEQSTFIEDEFTVKNDLSTIVLETNAAIILIIQWQNLMAENTNVTDHFKLLYNKQVLFIISKLTNNINTYVLNEKNKELKIWEETSILLKKLNCSKYESSIWEDFKLTLNPKLLVKISNSTYRNMKPNKDINRYLLNITNKFNKSNI